MAIDGNKIKLSDPSLNYVIIPKPIYPYTTKIDIAINILKADDGSYAISDEGVSYDIRKCDAQFVLTVAEHTQLMSMLLDDNKGRGKSLVLDTNLNTGFFPFGPDKGDAGPFNVSVEIIEEGGIGPHPFKMFISTLRFTCTDNVYPAYTFPSDPLIEGVCTLGNVENVRFPVEWFIPDTGRMVYTTTMQGGKGLYRSLGKIQDDYDTSAVFKFSHGKACRVIDYITTSNRSLSISAMPLIVPNDTYLFGIDNGAGGTYSVQLIQDLLEITVNDFNFYSVPLYLHRIMGA